MKQGMHETVSQFAGRVEYQLMELQTTFPGAIPQYDEEEIKKGRLYGGLKLHLKSAMTFCREMANEGKDLTYHQLLKIARLMETDHEDKEPSRHQEDKGKVHHSSSKARKDFDGKPAVRKIQVTTQEPSESEESPDEQPSPAEEESEEETYEVHIFKAGLSFEKEHGHCFRCGKEGQFARDCPENKEEVAKKNLISKEVPKKGDRKPQEKVTSGKKRVKLRPMKTPDLNPDVMSHWIGCDTITWCKIEDDSCLALLDISVTVNVITAQTMQGY